MGALYHLVKKELLLLRRDWHALLLLFLMPTAFILIMSLALKDTFSGKGFSALKFYLVNFDKHPVSDAVASRIRANPNFQELAANADLATLKMRVQNGGAQFLLSIPKGYGEGILKSKSLPLLIQAGSAVEPVVFKLFEAAVRESVSKVYLQEMMAPYTAEAIDLEQVNTLVESRSLYGENPRSLPSSVQQNVPAWLVFAMFFIAIPLSTTWVQERSLGTMARLRTMRISGSTLLLGKLLPYMLVNLIQVLLMLWVGVKIVPLLGGESLNLGNNPGALALIALATSFAAVSFALLIANLVSTSDQATIFTGVCNLVLAVIGGIMVPRFIMPLSMQRISEWSPLGWGLDGFLDVFLRQGGIPMVMPRARLLFFFGLACLALAALKLGHRRAK